MASTEANPSTAEASNSNQKAAETSDVNSINRRYLHFNFLVYVETSEKRSQHENHLNRLQNLRKELNNIKETEWQYEPIEKLIGQA